MQQIASHRNEEPLKKQLRLPLLCSVTKMPPYSRGRLQVDHTRKESCVRGHTNECPFTASGRPRFKPSPVGQIGAALMSCDSSRVAERTGAVTGLKFWPLAAAD